MNTISNTSPINVWIFFLLVLILSIPFYMLGFLPDDAWRRLIPINLPISAFAIVIPPAAAMIMVYTENGASGIRSLFARVFDYRRTTNMIWYIPAVFIFPCILTISYIIMLILGMPLPEPKIVLMEIPIFFVVFFIGAVCEEIGWSGYAIDRLKDKWGAVGGALIIGVIWAVWHIIPYIQTDHTTTWVVWHTILTIIERIIYVWIYYNAGQSVFAVIITHAMNNVAFFLFPNHGSHYSPFITMWITSAVLILILLIWDWRTLNQYKHKNNTPP